MAGLTRIQRVESDRKAPLMVALPIPGGLDGPYLVSAGKSPFLWISKPFPDGSLRAAVRKGTLEGQWQEAVAYLLSQSKELEWGNVFRYSEAALRSGFRRFEEYDLPECLVLAPSVELGALLPTDVVYSVAPWLPESLFVVLPLDLSYFGTSIGFKTDQWATLIHNPSRGCVFLEVSDDDVRLASAAASPGAPRKQ